LDGRDSRTDGGKGTSGRRLERQRRLEKEDIIIVQWAQEDVETSYNLLNNNKIITIIWDCSALLDMQSLLYRNT
jgi:hypothetical protein